MECKFCNNVISYLKDKMPFHLGYQYDDNGWTKVTLCSKAQPQVKALFAWYGKFAFAPLDNMEIPTHFPL